MPNYNKVILAGHMTRDIEIRHTQSGNTVGKFGMAVNHKYGDRETVCFVDITAWGKQAETIDRFLGKGSPLLVEGRLDYQTWDDNETGKKRSKHEVVLECFSFLGSKGEKQETGVAPDDIPF